MSDEHAAQIAAFRTFVDAITEAKIDYARVKPGTLAWLLDRIVAMEADLEQSRRASSAWKRTATRYRTMLRVHRDRLAQAAADLVQARQCSAAWKAAATAHRSGEIGLLASVCAMQGVLNDIRMAAGMVDGVDIVVGTVALRQERDQARQALADLHRGCLTSSGQTCKLCFGTWIGDDDWPEIRGHHAWCPVGKMLAGHHQAARDDGAEDE